MTRTILDSGPLVAFYCKSDRHHAWAFGQFRALSPPLLTCEPVLTESCHLIRRNGGDPSVVIRAVREGILQVGFDVETEARALEELMGRYAETPMSLADACLVRMAEVNPDCRVFTHDADFRHYRRNRRQVIPLLSPW